MRKKTTKQILIEKFVCEPIPWAQEMKILSRLLTRETEDFLKFFVIGKKQKSLLWFFTKEAAEEIKKQKRKYELLKPKEVEIYKDDNSYIRQTEKTKTIKDLLK